MLYIFLDSIFWDTLRGNFCFVGIKTNVDQQDAFSVFVPTLSLCSFLECPGSRFDAFMPLFLLLDCLNLD